MNKGDYPDWKSTIIKKYLPQFSYIKNDNNFFATFVSYAKLFKKRNGHVDIKYNDIIENYKIGKELKYIKELHHKNKLSLDKVKQLKELGINLKSGMDIRREKKIGIAKDAVDNGFVVTYLNQEYKGINLYNWIKWNVKNRVDVLNDEEIDIIEKLTGKSLSNFFVYKKAVLVVDLIENKEVGRYESQSKAAKDIQKIYGFKTSATAIKNCLTNVQKSPYMGRLIFKYIDSDIVCNT